MPKNKGGAKKKKAAVQKLADAVKTPVTTKPDAPELDEAFLAPVSPPSPFDNALKEFDPGSSRDFGRKMRDAGAAATRVADRVEEARQLSRQIDALESEFVPATQKQAAQKAAADALKGLDAAAAKAVTDRAELDRQFLAGWQVAKQLKAPPLSQVDGKGDVGKRLKATAILRENQEKALDGAKTVADRMIAAWPPVDEAAGKVQAALTGLNRTIQDALDKRAAAAEREETQRQLVADAKDAVVKAEQMVASKLFASAATAKVPVDPQIALLAKAATEAAAREDWPAALDKAQQCIAAARLLQRAVSKAAGAETTYIDESKRIFAMVVALRSDLTRLKIRPEGPFAELKKFEDAAKAAALKKAWGDAMEALSDLEDRVELGNKVIPRFDRYLKGDPAMLLQATFDKVVALKSLKTNEELLAKLDEVYKKQCDVAADDWRAHLGYVPPFKGSAQNHYSTFYDSIVADTCTVYKRKAGAVASDLFGQAGWLSRIHATYQFAGVNHHKYYGGFYSGGLHVGVKDGLDEQHPEIRQALDTTYAAMVDHMYDAIEDAIEKHGRVGGARLGPTVS